jgi:hypothetical protein
MAVPLTECTKEERRFVIVLWSESMKTDEIYGRMTVQYGDNCMNQRQVYEWLKWFKGGRTSVDDLTP